jgi:hypothetical protein
MGRISFNNRSGRIKVNSSPQQKGKSQKTVEEVVREMKSGQSHPSGDDYRERSLALHGLVCARCSREFDQSNRHLLTVHHKDGNHFNNPPDGSNWENLCIYCHEDIHSRGLLGEYMSGISSGKDVGVVYEDKSGSGVGILGEKLSKLLQGKKER